MLSVLMFQDVVFILDADVCRAQAQDDLMDLNEDARAGRVEIRLTASGLVAWSGLVENLNQKPESWHWSGLVVRFNQMIDR